MRYHYQLFIISIAIIIICSGNLNANGSIKTQPTSNLFEKNKILSNDINNCEVNDEILDIIYPTSTIPKIVEKEKQFLIQIQSEEFDSIYAFLSTAYEIVTDTIWLDINNYNTISENNYEIMVTIPSYTPIELYNLTVVIVKDNKNYSCTEPRAVDVIENFSDTFSFVHLTDFHVGDIRGIRENLNETIGWKSIKKSIEEINLLKPDFVIISGDLVFGQYYPFEYSREYKICYDIIQLFDVPTYLCPGNHDGYNKFKEDGLEFWQKYFGPLYYSFDFGDYHFIAANSYDMSKIDRLCFSFIPLNWGGSIRDEQFQWIENNLESTNSKMTFMFLHHNPLWETTKDSLVGKKYYNRLQLLDLIDEYNVDMVLAGHVHYDNITIQNDTIFVTTTTPESSHPDDAYWGYRLIEMKDGEVEKYNYKEPKYSIPSYRLNYSVSISEGQAEIKIENDLEQNITAHFNIVLPLGSYSVDRGIISMVRDDDKNTELYIESFIDQLSETTITISQNKL